MRVDIPSAWFELDPRVDDLPAEILRSVPAEHLEALGPDRAQALLLPALEEVRKATAKADVLLLAGFVGAYAGEGDEPPYVVAASLAAVLSPPLAGGLTAAESAVRAGRADARRDMRRVTLDGGDALMTSGRGLLRHDTWDEAVPVYGKRFYVDVPDDDRFLVLSFLTPNLDLIEQFDAIFDTVADSLVIETDAAAEAD